MTTSQKGVLPSSFLQILPVSTPGCSTVSRVLPRDHWTTQCRILAASIYMSSAFLQISTFVRNFLFLRLIYVGYRLRFLVHSAIQA